jgi:uracil-DNA glycosylase family 4
MTTHVPNLFPTYNDGGIPYRIALIGEAPGADEVVLGKPFVGASGRWLDYLLNRVGILRSACFLGNICQIRPPSNNIDLFPWDGFQIQNGLQQLHSDLDAFQPNLCVLLGGSALRAAKGYNESITKWRGSLFAAAKSSPCPDTKCIATFHPASSLRVYEQTPLLLFDLKRARKEGERRELRIPQRNIKVLGSYEEVQFELGRLQRNQRKIATDIEGYVDNLTCISFSDDPLLGYVIPFAGPNGSFWSEEDELLVWRCVKELLEDPRVPKVLQNGLYDRFVLAYTYGIMVRGVTDDTMLKGWEIYCELEKALAVQASIYTLQPYYKDQRTTDNWMEFWTYSGTDSCVTLEISNHQDTLPELRGRQRDHYDFNVAMQDPLLYMELRGLNYDQPGSKREAERVTAEVNSLQHSVNKVTGQEIKCDTASSLRELVASVICFKRRPKNLTRDSDLDLYCRAPFVPALNRIKEILSLPLPLSDSTNGELTRLLGVQLNTDSSPQMQRFLYETLNLPIQLHKKTRKPTTDALSVIKLYKLTERKADIVKSVILKNVLRLSSLLTQLQTLEIFCDPDGRVRCSYNVVGTETGRLSCSKSPTRSGYNLQTVTKKQRKLFRPDPEYYLFQCDLSGADGWTVAAHSKRLGDGTMWEDYIYGLKPAKIIARMYEGVNVSKLTREQIKMDCEKVDTHGWLYMACKRVQHGSNYGMKKLTMSDQILEDSYKYGDEIIFVEPSVCEDLQILYFQRYAGVQVWHRWVEEQLKQHRSLTSANGHTRRFFGRPNDHATLKAALSDEPQNNTTYATNLAVRKLWNDPFNRRGDGSLIIEPLHQIHDAVVGQFPRERTGWACERIRSYFDNALVIAGEQVHIPFEGAYGDSWSPDDLSNPL